MSNTIKSTINKLASNPKKLFFIDSIGALITAFLSFFVLRNFCDYIGLPRFIFSYFSIFALILFSYSFICFRFAKNSCAMLMTVIGYANFIYCVVSVGIIATFYYTITVLGMLYFTVEIIMILCLVFIELKVAKTLVDNEKKVLDNY